MNHKTIKKSLLAFILLFSFITIACTETEVEKSTKSQQIEELVNIYFEDGKFNGSILVAHEGEIIYKNGFGFANMEWDIPNQTNTKFRLASVSKQFTAMLIIQLHAAGKLDLNVPISTYLKDYPKTTADIITIHHLLTHSSGIPEIDVNTKEHYDIKALIELLSQQELEMTPGEYFRYSNSGYTLLGYIIEEITGKTYADVLQENIFTPLGMNNSGYDSHYSIIKNRASGYKKQWGKYKNASYIDMSIPYAAGSIYSTVEDLYIWNQALTEQKLISKKYFDLMTKPHIQTGDEFYGYGWSVGKRPVGNSSLEVDAQWHSGGIDGFRTYTIRIPQTESYIILLSNSEFAFLYGISRSILGIINDESYRFPSKSIATTLFNKIDKEGIENGLTHYEEIRNSSSYYHHENELLTAGYDFLQAGKTEEAATIFKIAVEVVPLSFNVYDSYGEALLALGRKEEAIENYKKSIELEPKNQNGVRVLNELGVDLSELVHQISDNRLKALVGKYQHSTNSEEHKSFEIILADGELIYQDHRFNYNLLPISDTEFINQRKGAELVFTSSNNEPISLKVNGIDGYIKINN